MGKAVDRDSDNPFKDELSMTWVEPGREERKPSLDDYDRRPDHRTRIAEGLELYSFQNRWQRRAK